VKHAALVLLLSLTALGAAGCATQRASELNVESLAHVGAEGVIVHFKREDFDDKDVQTIATRLAEVRSAVVSELALVTSSSEGAPPIADVVLYHDLGWGQERWLVVHAKILENPLRVRIPCALPTDDRDPMAIVERLRETIAHEVAEATVLTRVPIIDPYLRWMHDGIAESVGYRVLCRFDPKGAAAMLDRYGQYADEARRSGVSWVDLTRWRQLSDWIVHSEAIFDDHESKPAPLRLDDLPRSLRRLAEQRFADPRQLPDPDTLVTLDALLAILGESWAREQLPYVKGEADPRPSKGQFLCYDASFCFWLEIERKHPGVTAKVLAAMSARRETVLRSDDVVQLLEGLTQESLRPRIERFTLDRLAGVLAAETRR
jgi:hypothetical protein